MTRVGLAVDRPSLDEIFVLQALLDEEGVFPVVLYPHGRVELNDLDLEGIGVVINRMQHRRRRSLFTENLTRSGMRVLNPSNVENFCSSKVPMKEAFKRYGVQTAPWCIIEYPLIVSGRIVHEDEHVIEEVSQKIRDEVGFPALTKPTGGSRGNSVLKFRDGDDFRRQVLSYYGHQRANVPNSLYKNSMNPEGMLVEQYLPHPLDLRTLVSMKGGSLEYLGCLARVGLREEDVAKNTALGALPVGMDVPQKVRDMVVKAVEAMVSYIEQSVNVRPESFIVGVDIIPANWDLNSRTQVYEAASKVSGYKERIEETKTRMRETLEGLLDEYEGDLRRVLSDNRFQKALYDLDGTFDEFKLSREYRELQGVTGRYLASSGLYAAEINSRVDFATNTRNLAIPNLHERIVEVSMSSLG